MMTEKKMMTGSLTTKRCTIDHAHEYMSSWLVSACARVGVRARDQGQG